MSDKKPIEALQYKLNEDLKNELKDELKKVEHLTHDLEKRFQELKSKTEEMVKKYPLTSIAVAFGVGFLIARMFRRRS